MRLVKTYRPSQLVSNQARIAFTYVDETGYKVSSMSGIQKFNDAASVITAIAGGVLESWSKVK